MTIRPRLRALRALRAILVAMPLALAAVSACADDDGLAPVSPPEIVGTYVGERSMGEGEGRLYDTVHVRADRSAWWLTTNVGPPGVPSSVYARYFLFRIVGAELGGPVVETCPPTVLCFDQIYLGQLRGLVRGDTLNFWFPRTPMADAPSYYQFYRVSKELL